MALFLNSISNEYSEVDKPKYSTNWINIRIYSFEHYYSVIAQRDLLNVQMAGLPDKTKKPLQEVPQSRPHARTGNSLV